MSGVSSDGTGKSGCVARTSGSLFKSAVMGQVGMEPHGMVSDGTRVSDLSMPNGGSGFSTYLQMREEIQGSLP